MLGICSWSFCFYQYAFCKAVAPQGWHRDAGTTADQPLVMGRWSLPFFHLLGIVWEHKSHPEAQLPGNLGNTGFKSLDFLNRMRAKWTWKHPVQESIKSSFWHDALPVNMWYQLFWPLPLGCFLLSPLHCSICSTLSQSGDHQHSNSWLSLLSSIPSPYTLVSNTISLHICLTLTKLRNSRISHR